MITPNTDHRVERPFALVEMDEDVQVEPCPFCGTKPTHVLMKVHRDYYGYAVICQTLKCGMTGPGGTDMNSPGLAYLGAVTK